MEEAKNFVIRDIAEAEALADLLIVKGDRDPFSQSARHYVAALLLWAARTGTLQQPQP
jgi:hypothetical protein